MTDNAARIAEVVEKAPRRAPVSLLSRLLRNPGVVIGGFIVAGMILIGLAAPLLGTMSPTEINPAARNKVPGTERTVRASDGTPTMIVHRMGTDSLGRDIYSRVIYGARISILIGVTVAAISVADRAADRPRRRLLPRLRCSRSCGSWTG